MNIHDYHHEDARRIKGLKILNDKQLFRLMLAKNAGAKHVDKKNKKIFLSCAGWVTAHNIREAWSVYFYDLMERPWIDSNFSTHTTEVLARASKNEIRKAIRASGSVYRWKREAAEIGRIVGIRPKRRKVVERFTVTETFNANLKAHHKHKWMAILEICWVVEQ